MCLHGNGVLIQGDSGSGKSSLAAALIDCGAWLVADDAVGLARYGNTLHARAVPLIAGLVELRGLGLAAVPRRASTIVHGLVILTPSERIERLPVPAATAMLGVVIPSLALACGDVGYQRLRVSAFAAGLALEVA